MGSPKFSSILKRAERADKLRLSRSYKDRKKEKKKRRPSQAQFDRETAAVKAVVAAVKHMRSPADRRLNLALLKDTFHIDVAQFGSPAALWINLTERKQRFLVRNANAQYLEAIIYVYLVYELVVCSGFQIGQHIEWLCEKAKVRPSHKLDLLRLIARVVIRYDDGSKRQRKKSRRAVSRDALAIRWLMSEGIEPHEVRAYQAKHGGGVDAWSRLMKSSLSAKPPPVSNCDTLKLDLERTADTEAYLDDHDELGENGDQQESNWDAPKIAVSTTEALTAKNCLLKCFADKKPLKTGEGGLFLVVGDESASAGMRIIANGSLGRLLSPGAGRTKSLAAVFRIAKRVLGMAA